MKIQQMTDEGSITHARDKSRTVLVKTDMFL